MKTHNYEHRIDPVDGMVRDCTPKEFVEWLVKYKGLKECDAENVEINLREQFKWHRLQGRLDRRPSLILIAELWNLRGSVTKLDMPEKS
jgi:hypothetical protein